MVITNLGEFCHWCQLQLTRIPKECPQSTGLYQKGRIRKKAQRLTVRNGIGTVSSSSQFLIRTQDNIDDLILVLSSGCTVRDGCTGQLLSHNGETRVAYQSRRLAFGGHRHVLGLEPRAGGSFATLMFPMGSILENESATALLRRK